MWAFALWDSRKQELFCARDRFGIKPFYYTRVGDTILFASEIKALLAHPEVGRRPDDPLLLAFLAWGVLDHTGGTMFEGDPPAPAGTPDHLQPLGRGNAGAGPGTCHEPRDRASLARGGREGCRGPSGISSRMRCGST